ncbi:hypothetical protein SO694_00051286 [Aureococcus anophagefferens]|uniref:Uncharacterized protein n=1 Tax=Aureococcus anophagefferens TaxID=44056 RepID=A0ABR1FYG4_AURAN
MDREPTLWERQLQKQTATGVEAALAALEKRPVVATCTTPACAGELLAAFAASRARPLAFVVVRADACRTARELGARSPGSGQRASPPRARRPRRAVADDGFAEIARAAPDDEAVALALREALPREPASAPAGGVVVAGARMARAVLLARAAAYDGAALRAAPAAFAADALADDAARRGDGDAAVPRLDATAATVRPRDAPPRLCVLPGAAPRPWTSRRRERAAARPGRPGSRERVARDAAAARRDDAVAAALHFVAVARARPGRRRRPSSSTWTTENGRSG